MDKDDNIPQKRPREKSSLADRKQRFDATHDSAMASIKAEAEERRLKTERLRKMRLQSES
jgi:hypothetical protein